MKPAALALAAAALAAVTAALSAPDFDHLRRSVVRIQAVSSGFDWLHPFLGAQDGVGLGSGFVVQTDPYPLFVTNQHVINDAKQVTLQLLLFGNQQWEAEVVLACPKFDLALLVLRDPGSFQKAMASENITLQALRLDTQVASMGENVAALGFPLGQDALKISKGNIAGNEDVDGNICIQSTAPISPGSSGGPLLDARAEKVVGVNFAKATQGENINYVIPAWRVSQMVGKHLKEQPTPPADGNWKRVHVQAPKHELTTIEANEGLYTLSGGCRNGVYVSRVAERSFLRNAKPPMPLGGSFLVSVNGKGLDRFGMGIHSEYAADRVAFPDLFFMVPDISADVSFETCHEGSVTKHNVSMAWRQEYERGLRWVDEPNLAGMGGAFEMFGDISVMEMTVNHISVVISSLGDPGPARWLHPDFVSKPRLIINDVRSGSYIADVLSAGAAVDKVNGHEVRTLEEFRQHFLPEEGKKVWTLETDMGKVAALMFNASLSEQLSMAKSTPYLLTPGVLAAVRKLGLGDDHREDEGDSVGAESAGSESRQLRGPIRSWGEAKRHALLSEEVEARAPAPQQLGGDALEGRAAGPVPVQRNARSGVTTARAASQEPQLVARS